MQTHAIGFYASLFCFILCILCYGQLIVFGQAWETNLFELTSD